MPAGRYDIVAEQGSTFNLELNYQNSDSTGFDFTDGTTDADFEYGVRMQVRKSSTQVGTREPILYISTNDNPLSTKIPPANATAVDVIVKTHGICDGIQYCCNELDYTIGETVYQVDDDENDVELANATATAKVIDWTVDTTANHEYDVHGNTVNDGETTGTLRLEVLSGTFIFDGSGNLGSFVFGELYEHPTGPAEGTPLGGPNWQFIASEETTEKVAGGGVVYFEDGVEGAIHIKVLASTMALLSAKRYFYDIELFNTETDGENVTKIIKGTFDIEGEVTT